MSETQDTSGEAWQTPTESLKILAREKAFILVFCLSAIVTAVALTYVASDKYDAYSIIVFRPQEVQNMKLTEAQSFGAPTPTPPFNVISKTLQDMIKSDAILKPVVIELKLDQTFEVTGGAWYTRLYRTVKSELMDLVGKSWMLLKYGRVIEEDPTLGAVKGLRKRVSIVSKESYAFAILVRDKHPLRAAVTADRLGEHLVDLLREDDRRPGEERRLQLEQLLTQKRLEMERHSRAIEKLSVENDVASVAVETQQGVERWSQLELELVKLDGSIRQKEREIAGFDAKLETDYVQPDEYRQMSASMSFAEVELTGLRARFEALQRESETLRRRLQELPVISSEIEQLRVKLEGAKRDFVLLTDAYQDATIQATGTVSQVEMLHKAAVPSIPSAPVKIYHVGLAAFLSLSVAVATVYVLAFFNVRIFFVSKGARARRPLAA